MTIHILLLEDDSVIGSNIKAYLDDFEVDRCQTLVSAQTLIQNKSYDVAVLDRMVSDGTSLSLCRMIKDRYHIPVILETARSQIEDKEQGFGHGADDYLTKPYDLRELELRIRNLLKTKKESDCFVREDTVIDLDRRHVTRDGQEVSLSTTEFRLLALLIRADGRAVSRTDLLDEGWGSQALWGDDNKLDVYISMLRKKLGKGLILTEKGFGYKIKTSIKLDQVGFR